MFLCQYKITKFAKFVTNYYKYKHLSWKLRHCWTICQSPIGEKLGYNDYQPVQIPQGSSESVRICVTWVKKYEIYRPRRSYRSMQQP